MVVGVYLYDRLGEGRQQKVEVDIMKYLKGCFLKCELKLQKMTIEQFRVLAQYIPLALASRKVVDRHAKRFVPRAELGFATTKTIS